VVGSDLLVRTAEHLYRFGKGGVISNQ